MLISRFVCCLVAVGLAGAQSALTYKTVVLSKGDVDFKLKPEDRVRYGESCPSDVCTCESDVEYVQLVGQGSALSLASINKQLKADVIDSGCGYLDAIDTARETVSYISNHFVSVVEQFQSRGIGAAGSCHGSSAVHSFDLKSGKELLVADIIAPSSLGTLKDALPSAIVEEDLRQAERAFNEQFNTNSGMPQLPMVMPPAERERILKAATREIESYSDSKLLGAGLFIENGRVLMDAEGYYLSCADGDFHPAEIPKSMITLPSLIQDISRKDPSAQPGRQ